MKGAFDSDQDYED
jgi:antiviral helicase SLH1